MHSTNTSKYTGTGTGTSYHPTSVIAPSRGAASGLKTKNKYLQEFEKVKAGYAQRTQAKKLGTKFPGGSSLPPRQGQGPGPGAYGGRSGQRIPGWCHTSPPPPSTLWPQSHTYSPSSLPFIPHLITPPSFVNHSNPSEWYRDKTCRSTHQPTASWTRARGVG